MHTCALGFAANFYVSIVQWKKSRFIVGAVPIRAISPIVKTEDNRDITVVQAITYIDINIFDTLAGDIGTLNAEPSGGSPAPGYIRIRTHYMLSPTHSLVTNHLVVGLCFR